MKTVFYWILIPYDATLTYLEKVLRFPFMVFLHSPSTVVLSLNLIYEKDNGSHKNVLLYIWFIIQLKYINFMLNSFVSNDPPMRMVLVKYLKKWAPLLGVSFEDPALLQCTKRRFESKTLNRSMDSHCFKSSSLKRW